ncbi:MAG TPA: hypothetical protein VGR28_13375 [Candidatus Thermoplasmatota archaeon]|jgi:ABC-type proline/glycine betaine transport system permease subunit|nr:hypothetical protein [Candidatus Thermoplasmatota archaeon]
MIADPREALIIAVGIAVLLSLAGLGGFADAIIEFLVTRAIYLTLAGAIVVGLIGSALASRPIFMGLTLVSVVALLLKLVS